MRAPDWGAEDPTYMQAYGQALLDRGYPILPIMPGTKKPGRYDARKGEWRDLTGWERYATHKANAYEVRTWSTWPGCGIGIPCGEIVAVDIDILDEAVAADVKLAIINRLGETPIIRVGRAPKCLLLYRVEEPIRKIVRHPIEVLGEGQQFVAYATHPDTGMPYRYLDRQPAAFPLNNLPMVSAEDLRAAVDEAYALIPDHLKPVRLATNDGARVGSSVAGLAGTDEAIVSALAVIPNADIGWEEWNRIGMAAWAATSGSAAGFDAFDRWSQRSTKYDSRETSARWEHFGKSPPTQVGAGTIYHLAQEYGWTPPAGVALNPEKALPAIDMEGLNAQRDRAIVARAVEAQRAAGVDISAPKESKPATAQPKFPIQWLESASAVGKVARWICRSALHPHPSLATANTLAMFGTLFGRRYAARRTNTRTNLFFIAVAKPGSGKDHSRKQIKSLLTSAGASQVIAGDRFASGSAILRTLSDFPSRLTHLDEMGLMLQAMNAKNASPHLKDITKTILELYSSSSSTYHGLEYASPEQKRADIDFPNLNIYATTTPDSLIPAMSRSMVDNGTLSRILMVQPLEDYPEAQVQQDVKPPVDLIAQVRTLWEIKPPGGNLEGFQHIPNSAPSLIYVDWGDDVEAILQGVKETERTYARQGRYIWVRATELVIKLAMIEAICTDPIQPVVTEEMARMALAFVEWCMTYAESMIERDVADNETEAAHKMVLRKIRESGDRGITKGELAKLTQSLKTRERDDIVTALNESGQITMGIDHAGGRGRPRTVMRAA